MLWIRAKEKNLDFQVNVSPDLPAELQGDEMRIKQILINVLNNAIKYTKKGSVSLSIQSGEMHDGLLDVEVLGRGFAWLDTGTMKSLLEAANFVEMIQERQGITISALEEIAFRNGFIDREQLIRSADKYGKSPYGEHLRAVAEGKVRY